MLNIDQNANTIQGITHNMPHRTKMTNEQSLKIENFYVKSFISISVAFEYATMPTYSDHLTLDSTQIF